MAMSIVESMKKLANHGKTVVFTIHQPSSEIYEMFDNIYLLSEGRLAFAGKRTNAYHFFATQGYLCPNDFNPADFFIKTLSVSPFEREKSLQTIQVIQN